jgi:hypothetical protein
MKFQKDTHNLQTFTQTKVNIQEYYIQLAAHLWPLIAYGLKSFTDSLYPHSAQNESKFLTFIIATNKHFKHP